MSFEDIFNYYSPFIGEYGGDLYNVYRPNYSQSDNTPQLIYSNLKFRCDPVGNIFAEPKYNAVQYYDIFGPKVLEAGDILIQAEGLAPALTISHIQPLKSVVGFRTSRIGKITNSANDSAVFTQVYFEFLGIGYPGNPIDRRLEDSLRIPNTRVVIYDRPTITRLNMHLIETDLGVSVDTPEGSTQDYQRKWTIQEIDRSPNLMILTVANK